MTNAAQQTRPSSRRRQAGFTLVESLITLAVAVVATGAALPGFIETTQARHVEGAAAQLETDIQHARNLAVSQHHTVRMGFASSPAGSCYVVHTGPAGACVCSAQENAAVCHAGATSLRSVSFAATGRLQLTSNIQSMVFDPVKGTNTPTATLQVQARDGRAVNLVVNIMGRVRSCSPAGRISGYAVC